MPDPADDGPPKTSNRGFVLGLLFVAVLAVAGIVLVKALVDMVRVQDCAITGRLNC